MCDKPSTIAEITVKDNTIRICDLCLHLTQTLIAKAVLADCVRNNKFPHR